MEFLAFLYTVLLVAICLMMALLLYRSAKPTASRDDTELKEWLRQQLDAQSRQMEAKLAEMSQQNLAAMGQISETLQASVQSMSTALAAGQGSQQQTMEQRLQGPALSKALAAHGVPYKEVVYDHVAHGIGLGRGTAADGWLDEAAAFWEEQTK